MSVLRLDDGGELYHEVTGDGPLVVFVHAGVADGRMWRSVVDRLADDHTCVTVDLRGFGRSPLPGNEFSWDEDVADLIRSFERGPAVVVGCSFGGGVALDLALEDADTVAGLGLISSSVGGLQPDSDWIDQFVEDEEQLLEKGRISEAVELNLAVWVDGPRREPGTVSAKIRDLVGLMQHAAFVVEEPDGVEVLQVEPPACDRLDEIDVPATVLIGELDIDGIIAMNVELAEHLDAELVRVPGVAHLVPMEAPDATADAIRGLVRRLG